MRILIVDDEAPARERLKRLLEDIEGVELIGEAEDGARAVELIETLSPDLVLLDIQMPALNGFEVVEALQAPPPIIFVTAYDEYAIRAFDIHALDYLLKPFSRARLEKAIQRARGTKAGKPDISEQIGNLLEGMAAQGRHLARLAVRDRDRIRVLDVNEVDWISVENEQVMIHVGERSFPIRRTMSELEAQLDPAGFFRAHRSAIVNLDRVEEIIPWFKGSHRLRLISGVEVPLSRAQARVLRKVLSW